MNNYCTNCGKELKENEIKCTDCNTYVVDLKVINKKKVFRVIGTIIVFLIIGIIVSIVCYTCYHSLYKSKSLYNKYLKENYPNAKYVEYESCLVCNQTSSGCDGACTSSSRVKGCFKYYYKSNENIENEDIIIISNGEKVDVDVYTSIINKYGYGDDLYYSAYEIKTRTNLNIPVDYIGSDNIDKIYNMINELIENSTNDIHIEIDNNSIYSYDIEVTKIDDSKYEWTFKGRNFINPSLNDIKKLLYLSYDNVDNSVDGGINNND